MSEPGRGTDKKQGEVMNTNIEYLRQFLQYVQNTGGGATKKNFIEDWEPVGEKLWVDLEGCIREDKNGKIFLTEKGLELLRGPT